MRKGTYDITWKGLKLDPYRIFSLYNITQPAQQHAIRKLLRAGRSSKSLLTDIKETIEALQRWQEMIKEDGPRDRSDDEDEDVPDLQLPPTRSWSDLVKPVPRKSTANKNPGTRLARDVKKPHNASLKRVKSLHRIS